MSCLLIKCCKYFVLCLLYITDTTPWQAICIRDRPFNLKWGGLWFFVSFRIFFLDNTRVRIFIFCRAKPEFFFQNLTLDYMTKTLNQIIFFPPPNSEYFFQQHWESEYFFRKTPEIGWLVSEEKTFKQLPHRILC